MCSTNAVLYSEGHEFESPAWIELNAPSEGGKTLGIRSFYSGDPDVMSCLTCKTQSVWMRNALNLALHWQTYFPDAMADNTSLLNQAHVQYQCSTEGSTVEKPVETQTSIRLASHHLVRAPNS
jgi:hypothetical protein